MQLRPKWPNFISEVNQSAELKARIDLQKIYFLINFLARIGTLGNSTLFCSGQILKTIYFLCPQIASPLLPLYGR